MIGKITQAHSFYKSVSYVLGKPDAKMIGGNMVGDSASALAQEFKLSLALKPAIKHPVFHASLNLPLTDQLSDRQFAKLAEDYLKEMGYDPSENQYLAVLHQDTEHRHIHIVASRINVRSGRLVSNSFDRYRSQKIIRQLERSYNLTPTKSSWDVRKEQYEQQQQYADDIGQLVRQIWIRLNRPPVIEGKAYRVEFSEKTEVLRVYRLDEDQAILEVENAVENPVFKGSSLIKESDCEFFAAIVAQAQAQNQAQNQAQVYPTNQQEKPDKSR